MTSPISVGSDGWPKVDDRIALRRFSLTMHLLWNLAAIVILIAAAVVAERALSADPSQAPGGRAAKTTLSSFFAELGIPLPAPQTTAPQTQTPSASTLAGKTAPTEREMDEGDKNLLSDSILVAILAIVAVLIAEAFAHYQMKQAIHEHHTDIDQIVIPERTKCRGDSKAESEDSKSRMTTLLETHQIRDYRDTWRLLNRQLFCAAASLVTVIAVLLLLSLPTPRDPTLSLQLFVLAFGKSIIAAIGLWGSESERRVHPWRERPKK